MSVEPLPHMDGGDLSFSIPSDSSSSPSVESKRDEPCDLERDALKWLEQQHASNSFRRCLKLAGVGALALFLRNWSTASSILGFLLGPFALHPVLSLPILFLCKQSYSKHFVPAFTMVCVCNVWYNISSSTGCVSYATVPITSALLML